jgi:hypothetical protein
LPASPRRRSAPLRSCPKTLVFHSLSLWERVGVRAENQTNLRFKDPHPNHLPEGEGTFRIALRFRGQGRPEETHRTCNR